MKWLRKFERALGGKYDILIDPRAVNAVSPAYDQYDEFVGTDLLIGIASIRISWPYEKVVEELARYEEG